MLRKMLINPAPRNIRVLSLVVISIQTSVMVLLLRYSRTAHSKPYIISTAVLLSEILKLIMSLSILFIENGCIGTQVLIKLKNEIVLDYMETCKLALPAALYVIQNNLLFIALTNLDAATYQVTYQMRILTTALFSWVLLGKRLSLLHWFSLAFLMTGVSLVQIEDVAASSPAIEIDDVSTPPTHQHATLLKTSEMDHPNLETSWLLGVLSVLVSCVLSGFAGVFFERLVKMDTRNTSLPIRNIQLGIFSLVFAGASLVGDSQEMSHGGFFQGYSAATWAVIVMQATGGIVVSVTMKYADNILKGFATSISIVLSSLVSWILLGDRAPTPQFAVGTAVVVSATFLYGLRPPAGPDKVISDRKVPDP